MIIKGLFRRYKRWNPVHPTSGAFWGMGIGIGCGVGWGPGFGPDVVGYVGAGCGIGFCVGFTFGGVGIGLPSNWLYQGPYDAFVATRSGASELVRHNGFLSTFPHGSGLENMASNLCMLREEASRRLCFFNKSQSLDKMVNFHLPDVTESFKLLSQGFFPKRKEIPKIETDEDHQEAGNREKKK